MVALEIPPRAAMMNAADHSLTAFPDFNSFNSNDLRSAVPQPTQCFN